MLKLGFISKTVFGMIECYKALADHFSAQGVMGKDSTESKEVLNSLPFLLSLDSTCPKLPLSHSLDRLTPRIDPTIPSLLPYGNQTPLLPRATPHSPNFPRRSWSPHSFNRRLRPPFRTQEQRDRLGTPHQSSSYSKMVLLHDFLRTRCESFG